MSEFINNSRHRVDQLKKLILGLHDGDTAEETQEKLVEMMGSVPYSEVVQAEEELIEEASRLGKEIYGLDPNDFDPERVASGCLNKADVLEAVLAMGEKYGLKSAEEYRRERDE